MQRVLIVDDKKHNVTLLTDILESQGYNTENAFSGAAGID